MGNFYINHTVRSTDLAAVRGMLKGRSAAITPVDRGCIVVFDESSEQGGPQAAQAVAAQLSAATNAPVLTALVLGDDVLMLFLCARGRLLDSYCSHPEAMDESESPEEGEPAWSGDARKLCEAFGVDAPDRVENILRRSRGDDDSYTFETDRHRDLVNALGLSSFAVGYGYDYLRRGELPDELSSEDVEWLSVAT